MSRNSPRVPLDFWLRISIFALGPWLGCASCAAAQQLTIPEKPSVSEPSAHSAMPVIVEPATRPEAPVHLFWDRTNMFLFSGVSIFRGLDYASTRNMQARGREEILLPDDVVNNSAGFAGRGSRCYRDIRRAFLLDASRWSSQAGALGFHRAH